MAVRDWLKRIIGSGSDAIPGTASSQPVAQPAKVRPAMAVQHFPLSRYALATLALASMTGCDTKPLPIQLEKYCVSDSGMSKYWLTLNTSERRGAIRYQYMGQDARYVVKAMQIDGRKVSGRADFQSSLTGETRGNPIAHIRQLQNQFLVEVQLAVDRERVGQTKAN